MSKTITLDLPDELYEQVKQFAEENRRSLEAVLVESLHVMFDPLAGEQDVEKVLATFTEYTDATLWKMVEYRLPWHKITRNRELLEKEHPSDSDQQELDDFVELYDRFVLLRSQALLQLKLRGYDMDTYLKTQ